jgi:hypothetical protein
MTVVEAMRCGLPVVSTACPVGPPEIINDGIDGLLVPVGDVDAIAGGLRALIEDDDLRRRMSVAARENARRFDPTGVAGAYENLFRQLWESRRTARWRASATGSPLTETARRVRMAAGRVLLARLPQRLTRSSERDDSPVANCLVDADGVVSVSVVRTPAQTGPLTLVCRERSDKQSERLVRVPAPIVEVDGAAVRVAVLSPTVAPLAEGRWNVYLEDSRGRLHRIKAGLIDLRALVDGGGSALPVQRRVPYRTTDDFLAVRSWVREQHAEVKAVWFDDEAVTIEGWMVGEVFGAQPPVVNLQLRGDRPRRLTVVGESSGRSDFRFRIPAAELAAARLGRHDDWDLFVVAPGSSAPARLARLLDDVVERKRVYSYPAIRVHEDHPIELVEESPQTTVRVKPYFTIDSDFSLVVTDR